MTLSILAGIFIALGCIIYLSIGGAVGAVLFSIGLLSVLYFKAHLFTGKAGLFADNGISVARLGQIWLGNAIGCVLMAVLLFCCPVGLTLA